MEYEWDGMRKIPWSAVIDMHLNHTLAGCFYLYPDGTEAEIQADYKTEDIVKHHENGGEFGLEKLQHG